MTFPAPDGRVGCVKTVRLHPPAMVPMFAALASVTNRVQLPLPTKLAAPLTALSCDTGTAGSPSGGVTLPVFTNEDVLRRYRPDITGPRVGASESRDRDAQSSNSRVVSVNVPCGARPSSRNAVPRGANNQTFRSAAELCVM